MLQNHLISIVEDDESIRLAIASLLRSVGHRVTSYESAYEFLISGDIGRTDCIIVDIQLPGVDGIELKHHLDKLSSRAPVIMITPRQDDACRDRAFASGVLCVLNKPFRAKALVDCVERALAPQCVLIAQ
jgi:FixJ family two-component response regulator